MAEKVVRLPKRKMTLELNIKVPDASASPHGNRRETEFDRAVAAAVKREVDRLRRV